MSQDMPNRIRDVIEESLRLREEMYRDATLQELVARVAELWVGTLRAGGKLLFCGNGGSAADAQHLAAELSGRYYYDRPPLAAEALHVNSSYLTAVANDYSFDEVYARMVRALGKPGDVLIALSTSGRSPNILRALDAARDRGMATVGFSGRSGGEMGSRCDHLVRIPSEDTPRIQECHMLLGHILCELTERALFPRP